jgi:hypothetical protein
VEIFGLSFPARGGLAGWMLDQLQNSGIVLLNDVPAPDQTTVLVVGVPRSGTTMIAKTLGRLGIYLGADIDQSISEDMRLAHALEGAPATLPSIIDAYNAAHDVWAFKRPTAYQTIDPSMFRNPRLVIPFRDPVAIARREELSMTFDFREHLIRATRWSADLAAFALGQSVPVMLVSYEKAIGAPKRFVSDLARFTGISPSWLQMRAARASIRPSPADYVANSQIRFPKP